MAKLRTLIQNYSRKSSPLPPISMPEKSNIKKMAEDISKKRNFLTSDIKVKDIESIVTKVRYAYASGKGLSILDLRDLRKVTWGLTLGDDKLIDDMDFLQSLCTEVESRQSQAFVRSLITCYLITFSSSSDGSQFLGKKIRELLKSEWLSSWKRKDEWQEIDKKYLLFNPEKTIDRFSNDWFKNNNLDAIDALPVNGVYNPEGFAQNVIEDILNKFPYKALQASSSTFKGNLCSALIETLHNVIDTTDITHLAANALLTPWSESSPNEEIKEQIQHFILSYLKDPRLHKASWQRVDADAKLVMLKWLNKQALEMFLQVVDNITRINQWDARREFWSSYEEAGFIDEAWVVFGPVGYRYARDQFSDLKFGTLKDGDGSFSDDHAVLMLRIGNLLVADWNHNGSCRIWYDTKAPEMYKPKYRAGELRVKQAFDCTHDIHGRWMEKTSSFIYNETGIRRPRRKKGWM